MVIRGAEELVRNYDVDGIHLDDYFYPGSGFDDATFANTARAPTGGLAAGECEPAGKEAGGADSCH